VQLVEYLRIDVPLALFLFLWDAEGALHHVVHLVGLEEWQVVLLYAVHLIIAKPIWGIIIPEFIHYLCIELVIIDGRAIGYIFTGWYLNADEAAATRGIAERMLIVGGSQERSIAQLCR